jgi:hypothetical protein
LTPGAVSGWGSAGPGLQAFQAALGGKILLAPQDKKGKLKFPLRKRGFRQQCPVKKLHVVTSGIKFASSWNRGFKEDTKCCFVILSGAKDIVFLRFFSRFAPSE